jgi:hypothetical protein
MRLALLCPKKRIVGFTASRQRDVQLSLQRWNGCGK